jgi:hypothetical protein
MENAVMTMGFGTEMVATVLETVPVVVAAEDPVT